MGGSVGAASTREPKHGVSIWPCERPQLVRMRDHRRQSPFVDGNITKRNRLQAPVCGMYVAGFSCQPHRSEGKKKPTSKNHVARGSAASWTRCVLTRLAPRSWIACGACSTIVRVWISASQVHKSQTKENLDNFTGFNFVHSLMVDKEKASNSC